MKIQTLTVVVGSQACNAKCPYCVSKMTPSCGMEKKHKPNLRNFNVACKLADKTGVTTVLLTGKGEPTLHMDEVLLYTDKASAFGFPFIELQTNGILFEGDKYDRKLNTLYKLGMTTISLSIAHYDPLINASIIQGKSEKPYNVWNIVKKLHDIGFSVRINCTLLKGYIDKGMEVGNLVRACQDNDVEQLTLRNVTAPENSQNEEVANWVEQHKVHGLEKTLSDWMILISATELLKLPHGATIYDYNGQNVCLNNCLTPSKDPENIRQLIFFPDGHLRYEWAYEGAILL